MYGYIVRIPTAVTYKLKMYVDNSFILWKTMMSEKLTTKSNEKVKTTILINKTVKKLAQIYAVQNDMTLQELIEQSLREKILEK